LALVAVVASCAAVRVWRRVVGLVAKVEALEHEVYVHARANAKLVDAGHAKKWRRQDWWNHRVREGLYLIGPFDDDPPSVSDLGPHQDPD